MNRTIYFSLLSFFLFVAASLQAQTPVLFSHGEQKTFVVHWQTGNDPAYQVSNAILRELARGNNKRPERTEFSFRFRTDLQLTRRGNRLVSQVEMKNFRLQGDYLYHGFDMTDVLLPQVEFVLRLEQRNKLVTQFLQRPHTIDPQNNRFTFEYQDTLANDSNLKLLFDELEFVFTNPNRRSFDARVALINDYFATEPMLQGMYASLQNLDMYQLDYLRQNQQEMQQIAAGISQIQTRDFFNLLNLRTHDPIMLGAKLNDILSLHQEQAQHLAFVMENLHVLYYERGLELVNTSPAAARASFQAALDVNPRFAPAMAEMARSWFYQEQHVAASIDWVRRAYQLPYRDEVADKALQQLSVDINNRLTRDATNFERASQHHDALQAWQMAEEFCRAVPSVRCSERIGQGLSRAHSGIYNELYNEAALRLRQGNLSLAEEQTREALNYQQQYSQYVGSADNAWALLNDIKNRQYIDLLAQGRNHLSRNSYQMALNAFESAQQIEAEFAVESDNRLTGLVKQAKRPLLMADLDRASAAVQRNELPQARSIIQTVDADVRQYDFLADAEITGRLNNIRGDLQSQHCANIQAQMDALMRRADQHIMEGKFLAADEQFGEIRRLNSQQLECGLSLQAMERRRAEVLPAITYQQQLQDVEEQIRAVRYAPAVDRYNDAGRYFAQQGVQRFRLEHKPIEVFCKGFHPDFVHHVARLKANTGEGRTALDLIYHLDGLGYKARQMRNAQEVTGRVLAREDASLNPNFKPRQKSKEYSQGKRNLRYLRRAYAKEYRRSR